MPAKSQAQRALLNARFGHAWVKVHGFDNAGKLPAHVKKKGKAVKKKKPATTKGKRKLPKRGQRTAKNRKKGY